MKSKAPLALMEQIIMVLVFAVAATACVRVFVYSSQLSRRAAVKDAAIVEAQNTAEALKCCGGNFEEALRMLEGSREENGGIVKETEGPDGTALFVHIQKMDSGLPLLGMAEIVVSEEDGSCLYRLETAWQEESA